MFDLLNRKTDSTVIYFILFYKELNSEKVVFIISQLKLHSMQEKFVTAHKVCFALGGVRALEGCITVSGELLWLAWRCGSLESAFGAALLNILFYGIFKVTIIFGTIR